MAEVTGVSIDVDLDIGDAIAKTEWLRAEIETLNKEVNVDVNVNRDQLDKVKNDVRDMDIGLDVDTRFNSDETKKRLKENLDDIEATKKVGVETETPEKDEDSSESESESLTKRIRKVVDVDVHREKFDKFKKDVKNTDLELGVSTTVERDDDSEKDSETESLTKRIKKIVDVEVHRDQFDKLKKDIKNTNLELGIGARLKDDNNFEQQLQDSFDDVAVDVEPKSDTSKEDKGKEKSGSQDLSHFIPSSPEEARKDLSLSDADAKKIARNKDDFKFVSRGPGRGSSGIGLPDSAKEASTNFGLTDKDAKKVLNSRRGFKPGARGIKDLDFGIGKENTVPVTLKGEEQISDTLKIGDDDIDVEPFDFGSSEHDFEFFDGSTSGIGRLSDQDALDIVNNRKFRDRKGRFDGKPVTPFPKLTPTKTSNRDFELGREVGAFDPSGLDVSSSRSRGRDSGGGFFSFIKGNFGRRRGGGGGGGGVGGGLIDSLSGGLRRLIPSMQKWWKLLGLILPLLISVAAAGLGVAAAFGAIGVAAGAIMGLGLIGHGEDMASAFNNAKQEINDLKKGLFEVFQTPAQKFAPIQERLFDMIPGQAEGLAESLEGIVVFEPVIEMGIAGAFGFLADLVDLFVKNSEAISEIAILFGRLLGKNVIGFFRFLIQQVSNNADMLIRLGTILKKIALIVFNFSKAFSGVVIALTPLIDVLLFATRILNNKFVTALIAGLVVMFAVVKAGLLLGGVIGALTGIIGGGFISSIISGVIALQTLIAKMLVAKGVAAGLAMTLSAATLGIGAIAGAIGAGITYKKLSSGMGIGENDGIDTGLGSDGGPGGAFGSGPTTINNDNRVVVEGNADKKTTDRIGDIQNEMDVRDKRERDGDGGE